MYINASSLMTGLKRIFKNTIAPHDTVAAWEQLFWCVVWDAQSALHVKDKLHSEEGIKRKERTPKEDGCPNLDRKKTVKQKGIAIHNERNLITVKART